MYMYVLLVRSNMNSYLRTALIDVRYMYMYEAERKER